jgi:Astacin (Peptidase family M12A)
MPKGLKVCIDRILPRDLRTGPPPAVIENQTPRAAFERRKLWPLGITLRVAFLDGTPDQHEIVRRFAPQWTQHANLKLDFTANANPHIRITFDDNDGAWSYIGRDCEAIPRSQATMNLGWQDEGVILHEFGHAIGLIHEHQNPAGGIRWNKEAVYRDLGGSPNFWDRATVDRNMFETYDRDQVNATTVDKQSIMLYAIPREWTLDGFSSTPNEVLSAQDKAFAQDPRNYPFNGPRVAD